MHNLRQVHKRPARKRVGRGGKRGTYSGRGIKGQKARAGNRPAPVVRELFKRYPKLRGYRTAKRQRKPQAVSLEAVAKKFSEGQVVSPQTLLEKGLVRAIKRNAPAVKIVGSAELATKLSVHGCTLSAGARKSIEKSGGKVA